MRSTDEPIIVEQIFNSTSRKLWNAITNVDEMKQWFLEISNLSYLR